MTLVNVHDARPRAFNMTFSASRRFFARKAAGVALLSSFVWAISGTARANGRFPHAQQLRMSDGQLIVTGTYGMLTGSGESGFYFVCEREIFGRWSPIDPIDPLLEVLPDGTIVTGSSQGLRVSHDAGCSFRTETSLPLFAPFFEEPPATSAIRGRLVDITTQPGMPSSVVALASLLDETDAIIEHRLYRSSDGATKFAEWGAPIPIDSAPVVLTLEVAASDPNRIYVSGARGFEPLLVVSEDGAQSWTSHPIAIDDVSSSYGAYIAGVSPNDADRVYVRVTRWTETDNGTEGWDDSLLVSTDGGTRFQDVLRRRANLLGFAIAPDGNTVLAGYGDPQIAPIEASPEEVGIYAADAQTLAFEHIVPDLFVSCLRFVEGALYACAREIDPLGQQPEHTPDFHLGVYRGSGLPGRRADFLSLLKLKDVRGPLVWADHRMSTCEAEWTQPAPDAEGSLSTCATLNACESSKGGRPADSAQCGRGGSSAGMGPNTMAGAAGMTNASGSGGSGGQSDAGSGALGGQLSPAGNSGDTAGQSPIPGGSSGCSCRLGEKPNRLGWLLGLITFGLYLRRRGRAGRGPQ